VKHLGPDPQQPGFHSFVKGCDCPGEGGVPGTTPGADPTGGDGQPLCVIGAKYNYHPIQKSYQFLTYVCAGICPGSQNCKVETGAEIWVGDGTGGSTLSSAEVLCSCQ